MLKEPFFRPIWLPTAIIGVLLLTTIGIMVGMSWRSLDRLQPVHQHLDELNRLQQVRLSLDEMRDQILAGSLRNEDREIAEIEKQINGILAAATHLDTATPRLLNLSRQALEDQSLSVRDKLSASLASIRKVLAAEYKAHDNLMGEVRSDTWLELKAAVSTFFVLPMLAVVIFLLLRKKIFEPLSELNTLMRMLARQDFKPAAASTVGPVLKPLFNNYNHMVSRLMQLEQQNRARHASLEQQVRTATHALLAQQRELAAAERLAAMGELAASLAHELRNPLASMQLALTNLRQETASIDHGQRLALIINELNRVTALLNALLSQARQEPENSVTVNVDHAVRELTTLVRYQIGQNIELEQTIPRDLSCRLPAGRLHQALLNLVLNATQAIGPEKGSILIAAERKDDRLHLSVNDDGPGFSPTILNSRIQSFYSHRPGGTGLGLAIVQRFARDLGGEIVLSNRHPHGASVILSLPCE